MSDTDSSTGSWSDLSKSHTPSASTKMGSVDQSFVGSIDQGTTSSRFLIFIKDGEPIASHQIEFKQIYPQPGWVTLRTHNVSN